MRRTARILATALALALILAPVSLLAEEGGHGEHAAHHGFNWMNFIFKTINFVIFFGALGYFLAKPIAGFLRSRSEGITRDLEEAREARDKAHAELAEVRSRLEGLEQEMDEIRARAGREAEELKTTLVEQARAECARIEQQTEKDLETMTRRARRDLREHAADIAIETAESLIREAINDEDRRRILTASLERVGR